MLAQRNQELAQLKEQVKERANSQAVTAKQPTAAKEDARVAIIGYSCILPGGENVTETWDMIRAGIDNLRDLPADRVNLDDFYSGSVDKNPVDKIYCKRGGFIPPFEFNPREFNFNMLQMEDTDANQTLSLLKVKEAMVDAGMDPSGDVKKNCGCILGIGGGQKASNQFFSRTNYATVIKVLRNMGMPEEDVAKAVEKYKAHYPEWRLDSFPGFLGNVTAGRCTNVFNLDGMNCVVDAACASSLVSIKMAMEELMTGDVRSMVAGACCTDCSIGMYMAFSKTPVFSKAQSVTAYDKGAGGMLIGEGCVMYILKRLAHAIEDGDKIHAVIRSCASSSDGKAPGIYAPTIAGQEIAIRRAYAAAGICPSTVTMVEGHGTGTPVGDAIELTALKNVVGEGPARESEWGQQRERVAVGSVKSNIGHLKSVAGCAGMMKVILALKHKTLPASINVKEPPKMKDGATIQETAIFVNTKMRPWFTPPGMPRRAGVSSFGFGGANYHCVMEEYEAEHTTPYRVNAMPSPILMSAPSASALAAACDAALAELKPKVEAATALGALRNGGHEGVSPFAAEHRAVADAFAAFTGANALRAGVPASHARVGFVVADGAAAVDVLTAVANQLRAKASAAKWECRRSRAPTSARRRSRRAARWPPSSRARARSTRTCSTTPR